MADVNVHPTKQEVRISKEKELMALISSAIAQSLREQDLIPDALENLAKSSTRGAAKPVQTSLPLKQTNLTMIAVVMISLSNQRQSKKISNLLYQSQSLQFHW